MHVYMGWMQLFYEEKEMGYSVMNSEGQGSDAEQKNVHQMLAWESVLGKTI